MSQWMVEIVSLYTICEVLHLVQGPVSTELQSDHKGNNNTDGLKTGFSLFSNGE